jgi:hypothetical protein
MLAASERLEITILIHVCRASDLKLPSGSNRRFQSQSELPLNASSGTVPDIKAREPSARPTTGVVSQL